MKKAQWKQDPRQRAFGKDPRDVLNAKLTERVQDLEEQLSYLKQRSAAQLDNFDAQRNNWQRRLETMSVPFRAYHHMRRVGVVMADKEEFKHLQGEDMDAFFGVTDIAPTSAALRQMVDAQGLAPSRMYVPSRAVAQARQLLEAEFTRAYEQMEPSPWQPLQKQK